MKLIRLFIKDHLLLHDLSIRFDRSDRLDEQESYRLDFLVGVNGSGKSTLLRTLVEIFTSLQTGDGADYRYDLEYELDNKGQPIRISVKKSLDPDLGYYRVISTIERPDSVEDSIENPVLDRQYLPERIIVYTTGSEEEWEDILNHRYQAVYAASADKDLLTDTTKRFIQEIPGQLIKQEDKEFSARKEMPFLLLRSSRLNAITLCGLLRYISDLESVNSHPLAGVLDAVGVEKFTGFSLRFRIYDRLSDKSFYQAIRELDPQPVILQQATDRLALFDFTKNPGLAKRLLDKFNGAFGLFSVMDSQLDDDPTQTNNPTLQEVNIFLQRMPGEEADDEKSSTHIPGVFLLDWLSDGERAFLGRMALLAMLDMTDSLIILDEPEAHFNDYWKREIINIADKMLSGNHNHVLVTTHSSIMLSDVTESQVTLLSKNLQGWSEEVLIRTPILAVDPSDIMVDWFETKKSVGAFATRYLSEALERGDKEELRKLLSQVGPGYWRYRIQDRLEEIDASSR
jgi:energy-coupling factor transporter ATP-binding protein EcfA2